MVPTGPLTIGTSAPRPQGLDPGHRDPVGDERGPPSYLVDRHGLSQSGESEGDPVLVTGEHRGDRLTRLHRVSRLDGDHEADCRVDLVLDGAPPTTELHDRPADPARLHRGDDPASRGAE